MTASASTNRRAEDVRIGAVIVAELKFRNVQRQIFVAHFMERADDAAFEDRPETFNRIRVHCSDNVLAAMMIDGGMVMDSGLATSSRPGMTRGQNKK